jgi:hypothetical protein
MNTPPGGDAHYGRVDSVDLDGADAVAAALASEYAAAVAAAAAAEAQAMAVLAEAQAVGLERVAEIPAPPAARRSCRCGRWRRSWGRVHGSRTGRCNAG